METRQAYLIRFLRDCARAADYGELGLLDIETRKLLVNGDLMREAADEFQKCVPGPTLSIIKGPDEELRFNLVRAEIHARQAHDLLYKENGPKRNFWYRFTAGRAQSILMSLYVRETSRKEK